MSSLSYSTFLVTLIAAFLLTFGVEGVRGRLSSSASSSFTIASRLHPQIHLQSHTLLLHKGIKQQQKQHHNLEHILNLRGGGELDEQARSRSRTRGGGEGKKRKSNSSPSKKRKKKKKTKTSLPSLSTENSNQDTTHADHGQGQGQDHDLDLDLDLATIKAILLPRKFSIPHLIRLISAFLFSSSLLECLRTSGTPFRDAVISTLEHHGMWRTTTTTTTSIPKITPMDIYWAKKLSQADKNILPPTYLPSSFPLLGLIASLILYFGLTILFPKWFVGWNVGLNYRRMDVTNHVNNNNVITREGSDKSLYQSNNPNDWQIISYYLINNNQNENEDYFHQSQFVNRPYRSNSADNYTGLEVLVKLSQRDQDMASDGSKMEDIQPLYKSESDDHPAPYYIELGQRRIYCNIDGAKEGGKLINIQCMDGGPSFSKEEGLKTLLSRGSRGLSNQNELEYARTRYAKYNDLSLPIPTVHEAFLDRLTSPLAVLQLIGRILTALEEKFIPASLNIIKNVSQHYMNARKSIVSAKELSREICVNVEDAKEEIFWTLRPNSWQAIKASDILPGDVFYLPSRDFTMPVDAIVLEGTCVAQEAVITGESVPQAKVPLESDDSLFEKLSIESTHRNSALFAGTSIIVNNSDEFETHSSKSSKLPKELRKGSSPVKCLAVKTGSYSSKGEIMRALSKSSHAGSIASRTSERDAIYLIGALSFFALIACASVLMPQSTQSGSGGGGTRNISTFRRVIQCTRILVASIPSELPLALSTIFYTCATTLRKEADVVCSEPGSLLSASQIDMVVFDKTGTLTSDTQAMTEIINPMNSVQPMSKVVLAGCHSLSSLKDGKENKIIGDPLDIASLEYSGWVYNSKNKSASKRSEGVDGGKKSKRKDAKRLWQIKVFPFDPTRRSSYALLLIQHGDGSFKLWKVAKGSTDSIKTLLRTEESDSSFLDTYDQASQDIGSTGKRLIALAAEDVTDTKLARDLFPKGLPRASTKRNGKLLKRVKRARDLAHSHLHIDEFQRSSKPSMNFLGFGCFDASIRPSTGRVIKGIRESGTKVCMLTGDSCAAALAVAKESQFFPRGCKEVAVLDIESNNEGVQWRITNKKGTISEHFDLQITKDILQDQQKGKIAIMMTGSAFEAILTQKILDKSASKLVVENMDKVSVISRSSPQIKQQVLSVLQSTCGRKVMMCGDGVNDISAMKTADTSAALLNGYGSVESKVDVENERRKDQAETRFRRNKPGEEFGFEGARIKKKLDDLLNNNGSNKNDAFTNVFQMMKEEIKRGRDLQKGGAAAARILHEEELLRKSVISKTNDGQSRNGNEDLNDTGVMTSIKPGEASLAAAFTFLRPCIDGADTIIRVGVAAAAFSVSVHRSIALNSLMACYNLATLYRDGFRYGDYMWNIELAFILAMDQGNMNISCLPQPKIPGLRPSKSIFRPSDATSVLLQAVIHLFVLSKGVGGAKMIQQKCHTQDQGGNLRIRLAPKSILGGSVDSVLSASENEQQGRSLLGRAPFRPNYITNTVFLLSIIQNFSIEAVNHAGKPFHGSLLESKAFCLWASFSILFCIVMVLEVYPFINNAIQLAPMDSKPFKVFILSLFLFDSCACFLADRLCTFFLDKRLWDAKCAKGKVADPNSALAADIEEHLSQKEREKNISFIRRMAFIMLIFTFKKLSR